MKTYREQGCTEACKATPRCTTCNLTKAPIGRSVPIHAANSYCDDWRCPGYRQDPKPGHLWPSEKLDDEGYV